MIEYFLVATEFGERAKRVYVTIVGQGIAS